MSPGQGWVPDRQFRWAATLLVAASMFMVQMPDGFTWAGVGRLSTEAYTAGGTTISKLQWLPFFGLGLLLLLLRFRLAVAMLPHLNPFLIATTLWVLASCLWSYDPALSLRRAIKIAGAVVIAWGVVMACWDYGRFERVLRWTILVFLLASLLFMAVQPGLGIHQAYENESQLAGSWRGLSTHKNSFGALASVGLLFWLHALLTGLRRDLAGFGLLVCGVCLLGARSSTSLLCAVLAGGLMLAALKTQLAHRPGGLFLFASALLLVPFLWLVILSGFPTIEQALGPLTGLLGRDLTFTGRVPLWGAVLDEIPQRPLLGAGFQAFWGPPGTLSDAARVKAGWISSNGHNGYLDTANELGLIGLALVLAAIVFDLRRARRLAALAPSVFALHAALHLYQLIANLSETMFWRAISMTFLLTTLSSFHLARIELDLDLRRRAGEPLPLPNPPSPEPAHAHP